MRVLMVNKFYDRRGGTERVMFDLMGSLPERGWEVIPFATRDARNESTRFAEYFPPSRDYDGRSAVDKLALGIRAIYDREARRYLGRLLDEYPCDIAHLHNIYHQLSPSILDEFRHRDIPVLMTVHDYKLVCPNYRLFRDGKLCEECVGSAMPLWAGVHRCQRGSVAESWLVAVESTLHRWARSYERGVDLFISPSNFLHDMLRRQGIPDAKLRTIPNAPRIATELQNPPQLGERPTVLYAGRLSPEKGVDTLLRAALELPQIEFRIAGDGTSRAELEALTGTASNIQFLGHLNEAELAGERVKAWVTVLPAIWYENAPMSVLESLAAGRGVLASRLGGLPEMLRDGEGGVLLPAGDVLAWAEALRDLAEDRSRAERMAVAALQCYRDRYRFERTMTAYLQVYEELLAGRRVSSHSESTGS